MCLPLMAAVMIAGAAVSATAAVQQAQAAKAAATASANFQRQAALSVQNQGADKAADQVQTGRRIAAQQVAAGAANGVRTDTGTPLALSGETAGFAELDALRITNNAQRQAWGYQTQADITTAQGNEAQTAGYMNAGSTLLSSASNAYFGGAKAGLWRDN